MFSMTPEVCSRMSKQIPSLLSGSELLRISRSGTISSNKPISRYTMSSPRISCLDPWNYDFFASDHTRSTIWALQRSRSDTTPSTTPHSDTITGNGRLRIRCPRCAWQPRPHDRWSCLCGHEWNTFDTGGVCPECGKLWEQTQCLRCHEWSRHDTWYMWNGENNDQGRKGNAQ
jgi:hypothetical protein